MFRVVHLIAIRLRVSLALRNLFESKSNRKGNVLEVEVKLVRAIRSKRKIFFPERRSCTSRVHVTVEDRKFFRMGFFIYH